MFENKTAWFSDSCNVDAKELWVKNGGKLEDDSLAEYIFSDSWEHDDTKIIYNSDAYLKQHLAVFSSQYVIEAADKGLEHVSLGKYFLIPPAIKDKINTRSSQPTGARPGISIASTPSKRDGHTPPKTKNSNRQHEPENHNTSQSSSSEGPSSPEKSRLTVTNTVKSKISANETNNVAISVPSNVSRSMESSCGNSAVIDNNSVPHIKTLPKVISCLRTVYLGKDGVKVKWRKT